MNYNLLCILGATATGKTNLAVALARQLHGEIISADSRQVYRNMDIGTGKDLQEYGKIKHHIIDTQPAGCKYNVFEYQKDFQNAFIEIKQREKTPILCGGSGLYLEAVLENYNMQEVPANPALRKQLEQKSLQELVQMLAEFKELHNTTDTQNKKRTIRALEIASYQKKHSQKSQQNMALQPLVIGISYDVAERRAKITKRLQDRLAEGMVLEVEKLLEFGIAEEDLIYYGLEYKYITLFLTGKLSHDEMFNQLNTAIHRFAKRQMTWFRRMERRGTKIHWLEGELPLEEKVSKVLKLWKMKD